MFADGTQSIYLADMSGDGLSDLVRIRNGEVCYWPNLGYGRFGAKVTMDRSPGSTSPICSTRTASGWPIPTAPADGYPLSRPRERARSSSTKRATAGRTAQLLGSSHPSMTSHRCRSPISWAAAPPVSSGRAAAGRRPTTAALRRSHVRDRSRICSCGVTTTSAPRPDRVRVVDRILPRRQDRRDALGHAAAVSGPCREASGDLRLRQPQPLRRRAIPTTTDSTTGWSASSAASAVSTSSTPRRFAALTQSGAFPVGDNVAAASNVPPVLTKTWFHTGVYLHGGRISRHLDHEYYREGSRRRGEAELSLRAAPSDAARRHHPARTSGAGRSTGGLPVVEGIDAAAGSLCPGRTGEVRPALRQSRKAI